MFPPPCILTCCDKCWSPSWGQGGILFLVLHWLELLPKQFRWELKDPLAWSPLQALSVVCGSCQGGATLPLTSGRSREPRSWILTLVPVPNKFNKAVFSFYLKLFVVSVHSCPAPWFGSTTDSLHCLFSLCIDASLPSNLSSSGSSTSFCSVNRKCVLPKWAALF